MQLKTKISDWSAGIPVVMLNEGTAEKLGIHAKQRLSIKTISKNPQEMSAILDVVEKMVKKDEIGVSDEVQKRLSLKPGQRLEVNLASPPKSMDFIKEKLNKKKLSKQKIFSIVRDIVNNSLSQSEVALFISAGYKCGFDFNETVHLIQAILESGKKFKLRSKFVVDKHSIGGIPGNRTTPLVVSICASEGLIIPKTSSRAITSAAGTADVIETISPVEFSREDLKNILKKTNACMVWGGALGLVPADSKIISIEKELGIDSEAQLLASIMSKKLAVGSKYILIDIPYGKYAKVSKLKAIRLKEKFERLGRYFKLKLKVVLTNGAQPIGNGIGPVLEMVDVLLILDPTKQGPKDLEEKSLFLAGEIFEMTGKAKKGKGYFLAKSILDSGKAFEKFKEIIQAQGGKIIDFKFPKYRKHIVSKRSGKIKSMNNKFVNGLARVAGCPLDKFSGVYLYKHIGDFVKKKEKVFTIYAESKPRLKEALKYLKTHPLLEYS